jgi:hypothetical protein
VFNSHSHPFEAIYLDELYWIRERREACDPAGKVSRVDENAVIHGILAENFTEDLGRQLADLAGHAFRKIIVDSLSSQSLKALQADERKRLGEVISRCILKGSQEDITNDERAVFQSLAIDKLAKGSVDKLSKPERDAFQSLAINRLTNLSFAKLADAELSAFQPLIAGCLTHEFLSKRSVPELRAFQFLAQQSLSRQPVDNALDNNLDAESQRLAVSHLTAGSLKFLSKRQLGELAILIEGAFSVQSLHEQPRPQRLASQSVALSCLSGQSFDKIPAAERSALFKIVTRLFIEDSLSQLSIEDRQNLATFIVNRLTRSFQAALTPEDDELLDRIIIGRLGNGSKERLAKIEARVLEADLCGLAISGGGIRSATFSLGVLQGLAMTGLLPRFDYLSTVSGGGFIGSWFSTWVNRDGFEEVKERLLPPVLQTDGPTAVVEAEPIRHLRLYSNYLAPRPGLFSFDGWVLIAIYLRNLLLNQSMLLLAVLSLFAGVRTVIELFPLVRALGSAGSRFDYGLSLFAMLSIVVIVIALRGMRAYAPGPRLSSTGGLKNSDQWSFDLSVYWAHCVIPWLIAALSTSLLFSASYATDWFAYQLGSSPSPWATLNLFRWPPFGFHMLLSAVTFGLLHATLGSRAFSCPRQASVAGLFSGAIGGIVIFLGWWFLISLSPQIVIAIVATLGVPMCLGVFVLANFLMVGFCGPMLSELEREWWSSSNSRLMYLAVAWLVLFGTAIFGPWLLVLAWEFVAKSDRWLAKALAAVTGSAWFGTLLGGLTAAKSSDTGPSRQTGIQNALAHAAPILFIVTLFLGVSLFSTWVMYDLDYLLEAGSQSGWRFQNRGSLQLLTDLNAPHWLKTVFGFPVSIGFFALLSSSFLLAYLSNLLGKYVGVNTFSLQNLYANRLVRCYLGASKGNRHPDPIVNMDPDDDIPISTLFPGPLFQRRENRNSQSNGNKPLQSDSTSAKPNQAQVAQDQVSDREGCAKWGPLHIVNGALNQKASVVRKRGEHVSNDDATAQERQAENLQFVERQAESFVFTPLYCGSEATGYCPSYKFAGDVKLGVAVAVSGAAVSPNMGYHSSPAITALLTVFNIRLGAWFGNPRSPSRTDANPPASAKLLLSELAGRTDAQSDNVYISDGGHFENMGVYELIRRRCRFIVAIDAGADPKFHENVGRLVRQVRIDFGILLEINMSTVSPAANGLSQSHIVVGRIHYGDVHKPKIHEQNPYDPRFSYDRNHGIIVWIKNSLTGDEPGDLVNHAAMHPTFPYDTTVDQFFDEPQFESYRALGIHSILMSLIFPDSTELQV